MKLTTGKRILLAIHWLVSVILIVTAVYPPLGNAVYTLLAVLTNAAVAKAVLYSFAALYIFLCAVVIVMLCRGYVRREERGFVTVDSSENGRVRISISAAEHMVRQAVVDVEGIQDLKVTVIGEEDAVSVDTSITMVSGSHVPTITMSMQRAIRQYVEVNCGVAVRAVSVSIMNVTGAAEMNRKSKRGETRPAMAASAAIGSAIIAEDSISEGERDQEELPNTVLPEEDYPAENSTEEDAYEPVNQTDTFAAVFPGFESDSDADEKASEEPSGEEPAEEVLPEKDEQAEFVFSELSFEENSEEEDEEEEKPVCPA